ncbi:MAG: hypothetical protein F2789_07060 [Actinobacteria bacterium]|nr:hypothetical protein [Actinomycetota bacterium]
MAAPFTAVIEPANVLGSTKIPPVTCVGGKLLVALVATLSVKFLQSVTDIVMLNGIFPPTVTSAVPE